MDRPARLFLCARCRVQVVLCSRCDRGNRYCGRSCRRLAREAARRDSASRYQRSRRGRLAHADRSRRWRQRNRHPDRDRAAADASDGGREQNVTHQGCPPVPPAAPLVACTPHTTPTPEPAPAQAATITTGTATATVPAATMPWLCQRCAKPQPLLLRQGFVRHGPSARSGWRHDHWP
jgi:hypothetical protein